MFHRGILAHEAGLLRGKVRYHMTGGLWIDILPHFGISLDRPISIPVSLPKYKASQDQRHDFYLIAWAGLSSCAAWEVTGTELWMAMTILTSPG